MPIEAYGRAQRNGYCIHHDVHCKNMHVMACSNWCLPVASPNVDETRTKNIRYRVENTLKSERKLAGICEKNLKAADQLYLYQS